MAGDHDDTYHPKDAIKTAIKSSVALGGAGFFLAAITNALQKQNVGAMSVFTRSGGIIAVMSTFHEHTRVAKGDLNGNVCGLTETLEQLSAAARTASPRLPWPT